jgi:hypothetical protein
MIRFEETTAGYERAKARESGKSEVTYPDRACQVWVGPRRNNDM